MPSVASHVEFVKYQAKRLNKIIEKHPDDVRTKVAYRPVIEQFNDLAAWIEATSLELEHAQAVAQEQAETVSALRDELAKRKCSYENLDITPHDLRELPRELVAQLSISDSDLQELFFLSVIEDLGGTVSLDRLIIELFKRTEEIHDRAKLNAKLYRMSTKLMLYSVPGKRGAYSIYKPDESDLDKEEGPA